MNKKNSIVIYVGDVGSYLSELAKENSPEAQLICDNNFSDLKAGVYYTSIGDLSNLQFFGKVLQQANTIVYAPPSHWSDQTGMMEKWTIDYLSIFACDHNRQIIGFDLPDLPLAKRPTTESGRLTDTPQIWVAGCSISHGVGVNPDQRYGEIISATLGLPVSYLTAPSSSIAWAADQILRSNIRSQDIIFWGLTGWSRLSYWCDGSNQVEHCAIEDYPKHRNFLASIVKENFFASGHLLYESILSIRQVDNFSRKINAKLVMATVISGIEFYVRDLPTFFPLAQLHGRNMELDIGSDGLHPGAKTHAFYANSMIQFYRRQYEFENQVQ